MVSGKPSAERILKDLKVVYSHVCMRRVGCVSIVERGRRQRMQTRHEHVCCRRSQLLAQGLSARGACTLLGESRRCARAIESFGTRG
jgi:hypothetical protein